MSSGRYMAYSPSPSAPHSPHIAGLRSSSSSTLTLVDQDKYLSELLAERHKISPFMAVLPHSYRLLNQEILRVTTLLGNASVLDQSGLEHVSSLALGGIFSNGGANVNRWASPFQSKPSSAQNRLGSQGSSSGLIVKRTMRVDITVDQYPNFNFVGRLLGPRGNSLKRVEASAECRVLIKGHGSIKDPVKACAFRDSYEKFKKAGAEVIGISGDDPSSHKWLSIRKDENEFGPFSAWNITGTCTGVQVSHSTGCLWPY